MAEKDGNACRALQEPERSIENKIESNPLRQIDNKKRVDSNGVIEKLMKQAKRNRIKERGYTPKEVFLGEPAFKIEWRDAQYPKKCACSADPCECQPHLLRSRDIQKRRSGDVLGWIKNLLTPEKPPAPKPPSKFISRLAAAVKAEIEIYKELEKTGESSANGLEFCRSTCISFLDPVKDCGHYAYKKRLLEKYLNENGDPSKQMQVPERTKFLETHETIQEEVEIKDLPAEKNQHEFCNNDVAADINNNKDENLKKSLTTDNCEEVRNDAMIVDDMSNRQNLRLLELDDQINCKGNGPTDERLKNQVLKVRRSPCPCSVYKIEDFVDINSVKEVSGKNLMLDNSRVSFIIKKWSCEANDTCQIFESKPDELNKNDTPKPHTFNTVDVHEVDKVNDTTRALEETNELTNDQREKDKGKTNVMKSSSELNKIDTGMLGKCYDVPKDFSNANTLSIKKPSMSEVNTINGNNENVDSINKQATCKSLILNDKKASIFAPLDQVGSCIIVDSNEKKSNAHNDDSKYLEEGNKNLNSNKSVNELKELNIADDTNGNDLCIIATTDEKFIEEIDATNKSVRMQTKVVDITESLNGELSEDVECNLNIEDSSKLENVNSKNIPIQLVEGVSRPRNLCLNKIKQCKCFMRECLIKLKFKELFPLPGECSSKKGPVGRWKHSVI